GPDDVRAKVSDRRLLLAILKALSVKDDQSTAVFGVIDKLDRQPKDISREKLTEIGIPNAAIERLLDLQQLNTVESLEKALGNDADVIKHVPELDRSLGCLELLGVREWTDVDLTIVRGLAYYTGIVFELFDAKGEFRAICGGGRYDTLLASLGGIDLPALGFG